MIFFENSMHFRHLFALYGFDEELLVIRHEGSTAASI